MLSLFSFEMNTFTPNALFAILMGIFLFSLYFQAKFKGFLAFSFLFFFQAIRHIFVNQESRWNFELPLILLVVVVIYSMLEVQKYKKLGKHILQPTNKYMAFAFFLTAIYVLFKIFCFDR